MSKDIWHTADVKPKSLKTFVYKTDKRHIGTSMLTIDSGWNPVLLPEFYNMDDLDKAERITKWCYLDDLFALETELERTRGALNVVVDMLKDINELLSSNKFDIKEVPLLNITQTKISMLLKYINIEQITALEQKDVK